MAISGKRSGGSANGGPRNAPPIGDDWRRSGGRMRRRIVRRAVVRATTAPRACRAASNTHRPAAWRRASVGNVGDIDAPN
ncbi:hypothetical protein [Burkholderia diffusa]|uniref:hypothetical protein n=1 Tax=Burkholderia diffusa TaxID=488732 RepID=UPI000FA06975|nr:hypothetical protein [Burkholderia diffusa]MBM2653559.1 hypothetical protein [Burkholderia diffusa]RQZ61438.1 hypothetical protein DIE08_29090 [Burkholderia sp. Bp9004]